MAVYLWIALLLGLSCTDRRTSYRLVTVQVSECCDGYIGVKGTCVDIDECASNNGGCEQNCQNNIGSYTCSCNTGYEKNGFHGCDDIDECASNNGGCEQNCHNSPGSYSCSCNTGYEKSGFHGCNLNNIDECASNNGGCEQICQNTPGSYTCSCNTGYEKSGFYGCIDIDECDSGNGGCAQNCHNSPGSYSCSCNTGYEKSGFHGCNDIDECSSNNGGCDQNCHNTPGSYTCSCNAGYEKSGFQGCIDISLCDSGGCEQNCHETLGSYTCSCNTGYEKSGFHGCNDIDECDSGNGGCAQNCLNSPGSYTCSCNTGYEKNGFLGCIDIDECDSGNGGCEQNCQNNIGSYTCSCNTGYEKSGFHGCIDIDECASNNGGCAQDCHNSPGSYSCSCNTGYAKNGFHDCVDIDECVNSNGGCDHICVNTEGSYFCECEQGYGLQGFHTCVEVVFGFSSPALTVHENEGIVHLTVVLNDTHEETTIVTFTTASDTANAPSDYVAVSDSLTFPPGASEQSVSIVIQDDQVLEGTERFLAVLAASGVKVQLVITIQDDDSIVIGFLNSEINSISEKEGNISVLFGVVSGTLGLALNVEVTTVDESTKGDFIGVSVNTTLTPSSPNASVSIIILQDNVVEDTESFSVNLMLVTQGLGQAVSIEPVKTSMFIIDQDVVTVGFKPDYLEVIETDELVTLTVVLLAGALERDLVVTVMTNFSSIDYSVELIFTTGVSSLTVDVPIWKHTELFYGQLRSLDRAAILNPNNVTVVVTKMPVNEPPLVLISSSVASAVFIVALLAVVLMIVIIIAITTKNRNKKKMLGQKNRERKDTGNENVEAEYDEIELKKKDSHVYDVPDSNVLHGRKQNHSLRNNKVDEVENCYEIDLKKNDSYDSYIKQPC